MDTVENNSNIEDNNSDEQQSTSEGSDLGIRPTLSQFRKSWGFRRTTIAKREFIEEVGELAHSPPLVRRGRSRRISQTLQTPTDTESTQKPLTARSVLDDLQWSAPSSPLSDDGKLSSETAAGDALDPLLWQDFGSAFHTAFSLLGGNEGLSMTMMDSEEVSDILEATDPTTSPSPPAIEEMEVADNMDVIGDAQPASYGFIQEERISETILISSQEDDSDDLTLLQVKECAYPSGRQSGTVARGGKGGRGRARGRGRGRGKGRGKGRGRGRGKALELQRIIVGAEDSDDEDEVMIVRTAEQQGTPKENNPDVPAEKEASPVSVPLDPAQQLSPDCEVLDGNTSQSAAAILGQFDDVLEEIEKKKKAESLNTCPSISDTEGCDPNALCCIYHQKHDQRFMVCCHSCQAWFHDSCAGDSSTEVWETERKEHRNTCPQCATKTQLVFESPSQPEADLSLHESWKQSPTGDDSVRQELLHNFKENEAGKVEVQPNSLMEKHEVEMETDHSHHVCTGPGCSRQALPDSVYCGTDCILQHAAITMKTLSDPKVPKTKGRGLRKSAGDKPTAKTQKPGRMSRRLAEKSSQDADKEEKKENDGEQEAATSSITCDPSLTDVQSTSIPPSYLNTTSVNEADKKPTTYCEAGSSPKHLPDDTSRNPAVISQSAMEEAAAQSQASEKPKDPESSSACPEGSVTSTTPSSEKSGQALISKPLTSSAPRHHETGALVVSKTTYVIPKKPSASQSVSRQIPASAAVQKPSSALGLSSDTRILPVSPAPSAPSSRPCQPNNQIRQSIQRSLTSILLKRICDCEDLEMSESEVAKLVASIETEMFDIFRNTDSKYMNKYRTIMFNLKDPKNKGLLYRVVHGEIGPFRLVRMSQKDMQAITAPEPKAAEKSQKKDGTLKLTSLQKPEAVKIDLPSLNPRIEKKSEISDQKKNPAPSKAGASHSGQDGAAPDILSCMLKDTTSEHKAHLFDLKCKICTGQKHGTEAEEPVKKKPKLSLGKDKNEPPWKKSVEESCLRAPPDFVDKDSPASSSIDSFSHLSDSPKLTIVESPASPTDSHASPTFESPASPVIESPASPTPDSSSVSPPKRGYTPVVIPAVSTVSIVRRDPRTAASRMASSCGNNNTIQNQAPSYAPVKDTPRSSSAPSSSLPAPKTLPKSILLKPSSTADPRLYGSSSRAMASKAPAEGDTAQFLAKQDILWKGFLNMLTVTKFVTKGYLVSGSAENLKVDLPDTIQIGGRILPETVWDYVEKLKTSVTKELCVIRFQPATEEEEVAYVSLFSYFSSRGRFGVVANISRSIKDVYLVPLSAKESIPSMLQPLQGPGFEKNRPNLLLGLAIVQKVKRQGTSPPEIEEKRSKVNMSKDPMWIPKPPVLYGSDKSEMFQPYDPETPAHASPLLSPLDSSASGSVKTPSVLTAHKPPPPVPFVVAPESTSNSNSDKNTAQASSEKTPLQSILKTLFGNKQSDSIAAEDGPTKPTLGTRRTPVSLMSDSSLDPIVQQYGQKSKVQNLEEEESDFDRPYDPEEEYDPAMKQTKVTPQTKEASATDSSTVSEFVEDDVAYDPEDETIFEDIQSNKAVIKQTAPIQTPNSPSCPEPALTTTSTQSSVPVSVTSELPTGTVVVSAATLTEQQRMLEELNKQIEEQKRQLKEQEEALRQQREAVGMFMAQFSVSDSLMSPPTKAFPLSQLSSVESGLLKTEPIASEKNNITGADDSSKMISKISKIEGNVLKDDKTKPDETKTNVEERDKYSSAGEIDDSDVAYDPEDESLFDEIQDDVFKGGSTKACDISFRSRHNDTKSGGSPDSYHGKKMKSSPKRRSRRERHHHGSPSRRSQPRSHSRSSRHKDRDRHRRSERDRSKHRVRDPSERQRHHHKDPTAYRHSRGHRRSPSAPRKKHSVSVSPKRHRAPLSQGVEKTKESDLLDSSDFFAEYNESFSQVPIKNTPDGNHPESISQMAEKDSRKNTYSIKTDIPDLPMSQNSQNKVSGCNLSTQTCKSAQQVSFFTDKCENTIPLREIEPPIRDSPESPDPDPRFVKHSPIEGDGCTESEDVKDPEVSTNDSVSIKSEKDSLPIGSETTISFKVLNQQSLGVRGQYSTQQKDKTLADSNKKVLPLSTMEDLKKNMNSLPNVNQEVKHLHLSMQSRVDSHPPMEESRKQNEKASRHREDLLVNIPGLDNVISQPGDQLSSADSLKADAKGFASGDQTNIYQHQGFHLKMENLQSKPGDTFRWTEFSQGAKDLIPNNPNPDWKCHEPFQSKGLHSHTRDFEWNVPIFDRNSNQWDKSGPVLNRKDIESLQCRPAESSTIATSLTCKEGPGSSGFMGLRTEIRDPGMHDKQLEQGPERTINNMVKLNMDSGFNRTDPVRAGLETKLPMQDKRRQEAPDFMGQKYGGPSVVNEGSGIKGQSVTGSYGTGFNDRGLSVGLREPDRKGFVGPHFKEKDLETKGLILGTQRPYMQDSASPDLGNKWPVRRGQGIVSPGPDMNSSMEESGHNTNKAGGQGFIEGQCLNTEPPWNKIEGPRHSDFREQRPGGRGLSVEDPNLFRKEPAELQLRGPGCERGRPVERGPHNRGRGGTVFRGPRPNQRYFSRETVSQGLEIGSDFCELAPDLRSSDIHDPRSDKRIFESSDFRRPALKMRGPALDNQYAENRGPRGTDVWVPGSERTGPGEQNIGELGLDRTRTFMGDNGGNFIGGGQEQLDPGMDVLGHHSKQEEQQFWDHGAEGRHPDFREPDTNVGPTGPVPRRREDGGPNIGRPGPQHASLNMESLGPDRRGPEGPNIIFGNERIPPNVEDMPNKCFPRGPQFRPSEPGIAQPDIEGQQFGRRGAHFGSVGPGRATMGSQRPISRYPNISRRPEIGKEEAPASEIPAHERQIAEGLNFRKPWLEGHCGEEKGERHDWKESGSNFRNPSIRHQGTNSETLRHERHDKWVEPESVQESPDIEAPRFPRTDQNFRGRGPMRRWSRGAGLNVRSFGPGRCDTESVENWSSRRTSNIEAIGNRRGRGDRHGININSHPYCPDNQDQEHSQQEIHSDWQQDFHGEWEDLSANEGGILHEEHDVQFSDHASGPGGDWNCTDFVSTGPDQVNSDAFFPGPGSGRQENEWREPCKRVGRPFFRKEGDLQAREQSFDRGRTRGRVRGRSRGRGIGRGGRGSAMQYSREGPQPFSGDPDMMDSYQNRSESEMMDPDFRHPGPRYRSSIPEYPGFDGEASDFGEVEPEVLNVDMAAHEHDLREEWRDPNIRQQRGPRSWDRNVEFPISDKRRADIKDEQQGFKGQSAKRERRGSHAPGRFQDFCKSHSALFNSRDDPGPSRGRKTLPVFNRPQNQPVVDPQRHRGALLPTPKEGPLLRPDHSVNHDAFSMTEKEIGHPKHREPDRGRGMDSRHRGRARGHRW